MRPKESRTAPMTGSRKLNKFSRSMRRLWERRTLMLNEHPEPSKPGHHITRRRMVVACMSITEQ